MNNEAKQLIATTKFLKELGVSIEGVTITQAIKIKNALINCIDDVMKD